MNKADWKTSRVRAILRAAIYRAAIYRDAGRKVIDCGLFAGIATVCIAGICTNVHAGAFVFAGNGNSLDIIAHPSGYDGTGGPLLVNVCIDPTSQFASEMEVPTQNIVNTWNELTSTTGNISFSAPGLLPSQVDFESIALHELGHCVGLAHPNLGGQTGVIGANTNFTASTPGANGSFAFNPGADGIVGSADDVRQDDENLHWFDMASNDPFALQSIIDATTFSRDLTNLPALDLYAANADRTVGAALGYAESEAVMQQLTFAGEAQRALVADDVHTLTLASSGLDMQAGTADDYEVELQYQGISSTNCDINITFDATQTAFAVCGLGGVSLPGGVGQHVAITSANIYFHPNNVTWYFNQTPNATIATCNGLTVDVDLGAGTGTPTAGNDVILGTSSADTIDGLGGDDTICGLGGNDIINGGGGSDWIDGGSGDDDILGSGSDDTIFGGTGDDIIRGGGGNDDIEGEEGDDTLLGQSGNDTLDGGDGLDDINGGPGSDTIFTGSGVTADTGIVASGGSGADVINGGPDADALLGSNGSDTINGFGGDDVITGGNGQDEIDGGDGDDDIRGQGARDVLNGGAGDDTINGGAQDDTINGGSGDDDLNGGSGDDTVRGDSGSDMVLGGSGDDSLVGGASAGDVCNGQSGVDSAVGSCETLIGVE